MMTYVDVIDIVTTIILAGAAMVTLAIQRKHNRLSVKPVLTIEYVSNDKEFDIKLKNGGLGTAIIKQICFESDKGNKYDNIMELLHEENRVSWRSINMVSEILNYNKDELVLNADGTLGILSCQDSGKTEIEDVRKAFMSEGITMQVIYCSLYEEKINKNFTLCFRARR